MLERRTYQTRRAVLHIVAKSGVLCSLYYAFCSRSFRREQRGVAYGRLKYVKQARNPSGCQYLLRRNIHLLEVTLQPLATVAGGSGGSRPVWR